MTRSSGPATSPDAAPGPGRLRRVSPTQRLLSRPAAGAAIITVFVWIVFAILSARSGGLVFLGLDGTLSYLDVAAQVGILATSVALLMIAGEFDLSIGSLVGFAGIVIGIGVTEFGLPVWSAILLSMLLTTMLGVLNGVIVVRTGLPSFIVTLATLFLFRGATQVLTAEITNITFIPIDRTLIANDPIAWLFNWSGGPGSGIKVSILWWIAIAALGTYLYERTRFGNWIAGVGGSPSAARNLGVPVARVKIALFAATALSASILGAVQSMTFFSADVLRGRFIELDAITTAVIGGSLLSGGYGSVVGAAIGALALGMARIGIVFASINADWYAVAIGTLLLVAVVLNNWIRRRFAGLR
ncbi:MAG: ABC transporter permease [Chloroflexi bacterium]|nr:ABC transporter permease [Chloroflexota bacterium]